MPHMDDIHNVEREFELNNQKLQNSEHVSEENKEALSRFIDKCFAEDVGKVTIRKYISNFHTMLKLVPTDFELLEADKEDLEKLLSKINQEDYAGATKKGFKVALKKFYKVMEGDGETYPDKVTWFDTNIPPKERTRPNPLDKEQIQEIVEQCQNDRDRAMYKVLYEGGLRPGELISLSIKDIEFDKYGVVLTVPEGNKTGGRTIRLVESERYLKSWISKHPFSDNRNAPLWVKVDGRNMDERTPKSMKIRYDFMRINLKRKAKEAGIRIKTTEEGNKTSEVTPKLFRHSRATHLATEMTEAAMKEFFGWTQGSDMPQTYIHLSGRDIDSEILQMYGIEEEEGTEEKVCPRCSFEYKGEEDFCPRCAAPFNLESSRELEQAEDAADTLVKAIMQGEVDKKEIASLAQELN